jgi:hypothetical protein
MGAQGRYGNGDVQWMTAGKGVQHAEMFPLINQDAENPLELFQIWLNLPRSGKFVEPYFKMFWEDAIPKYTYADARGKNTIVELIAGSLGNEKAPQPPPDSWAANPQNEIAIWNIRMDAGMQWKMPKASAGINRTLYFYKGDKLILSGAPLENYHMAEIEANEELILESGTESCHILMLQGKPIGEPVVQYGPFVMNSKQEIQQAFDDYQKTQFGGWPWAVNEPVHPPDQGRFARHADGRMEVRG